MDKNLIRLMVALQVLLGLLLIALMVFQVIIHLDTPKSVCEKAGGTMVPAQVLQGDTYKFVYIGCFIPLKK